LVATLILGILAHVDAGKTTLTERLLVAAGVTGEADRVDDGTTPTDFLPPERQRGITIGAAVASLGAGDLAVNLIGTPGHPDFIAEVDRPLGVLDGAVLVASTVQGVQPQTRLLWRAAARLGIPAVIFVNEIDRPGAGYDRVLRNIAARLTPAIVAMGTVRELGTRRAGFTASGPADPGFAERLAGLVTAHDDALPAACLTGRRGLSYGQLRSELAAQAKRAVAHPVFFGSAVTGTVFKVGRGPSGEPAGYVRMFSGTVRTRGRLRYGNRSAAKVTAISAFGPGCAVPAGSVAAGQIAKVWGLAGVRVGEAVGLPRPAAAGHHFAPPALQTVVVPARPADKAALHAALTQLAEQDPLINLRQDDLRHELLVWLYGEVQKGIIQATLASDFGLTVGFRESTTIRIEHVAGTGAAAEIMDNRANPFRATIGLRIDPAAVGSGVHFRLDVDVRMVPMYVYKTADNFADLMAQYVHRTLQQGLYGWQVVDCTVTMNEPINAFRLELPADCMPAALTALARLRATPQAPQLHGTVCVLEGEIPAGQVHELQQQLPALTQGEGMLEWEFACYQPVRGTLPTRPRTGHNPLNRKEYLLQLQRRLRDIR
jgi:ribosomal protection tetracycline resistance protein